MSSTIMRFIKELKGFPDIDITQFEKEEGMAYKAAVFECSGKRIRFRKAKNTPLKVGLFVTLWKRNEKNITAPFHEKDDFDYVLIAVCKERNSGVFLFPKQVLVEQKIIAGANCSGKRGFRVYPPWETELNTPAQKTMQWQCPFFHTV